MNSSEHKILLEAITRLTDEAIKNAQINQKPNEINSISQKYPSLKAKKEEEKIIQVSTPSTNSTYKNQENFSDDEDDRKSIYADEVRIKYRKIKVPPPSAIYHEGVELRKNSPL